MRPGPRAVGDLLVSAVPALRDRLVEVELRAAWTTLVGADAARRSHPLGLVNGCLHVAVDNSPWLQELTLRSEELRRRIAARFSAVRTLRLTLGRAEPALHRAQPAAVAARPPALTPHEIGEIDAAVASIRDPDARAAARRLLGTAKRSNLQRGVV